MSYDCHLYIGGTYKRFDSYSNWRVKTDQDSYEYAALPRIASGEVESHAMIYSSCGGMVPKTETPRELIKRCCRSSVGEELRQLLFMRAWYRGCASAFQR